MQDWATTCKNVACGQLVSVLSMTSLVMAKYLVMRNISVPAFMNLLFYTSLFLIYIAYFSTKHRKQQKKLVSTGALTPASSPASVPPFTSTEPAKLSPSSKSARWWYYVLLAFLDFEANYFAVKALWFTDYVNVGLLLNLAIPFIAVLCYFVCGTKYSWKHIAGCGIAVLGGLVLFIDSQGMDLERNGSSQLYGCVLATLAAFLYGASNIVNQWCVNCQGGESAIESMGKMGGWGSLFAIIQMLLLETRSLSKIDWAAEVFLCMAGYVVALLAFYTVISVLLHTSGSIAYNLSVLLSNLYLVLASCLLFGETPTEFFGVSLMLVLVGLGLYSVEPMSSKGRVDGMGAPAPPQVSFKSMKTPRDDLYAIKIEVATV